MGVIIITYVGVCRYDKVYIGMNTYILSMCRYLHGDVKHDALSIYTATMWVNVKKLTSDRKSQSPISEFTSRSRARKVFRTKCYNNKV